MNKHLKRKMKRRKNKLREYKAKLREHQSEILNDDSVPPAEKQTAIENISSAISAANTAKLLRKGKINKIVLLFLNIKPRQSLSERLTSNVAMKMLDKELNNGGAIQYPSLGYEVFKKKDGEKSVRKIKK